MVTMPSIGKIQGILSFDYEKNISFTYYLNPTPNDRNMEFDPSRNLFGRLALGRTGQRAVNGCSR
jgi:hypothetical protein